MEEEVVKVMVGSGFDDGGEKGRSDIESGCAFPEDAVENRRRGSCLSSSVGGTFL